MSTVTQPPRTREEQRAATEAAIVEAAWHLIATSGPDGASLRDVARRAGCTHALVVNHFGSKDGLVDAIGDRLVARIADAVEQAWPRSSQLWTDPDATHPVATHPDATAPDPLFELLTMARAAPSCARLLVRCGLGDLRPAGFPEFVPVEHILTIARCGAPGPAEHHARLGAYGAASLLLGWLTFEGFVVAGTDLGALEPRRRDLAIVAAAREILMLARSDGPSSAPRPIGSADAAPADARSAGATPADMTPADAGKRSARDALLASAVELFAERGPASVSAREVARHAGVNHGLVHRHFGSKEALLTEAIEAGSTPVFPAALAADGFDLDGVVRILHAQPHTARLIARTLVDGIEINLVRRQFPVLHRLLDRYDSVPTGPGRGTLEDPRIAAVAAAALALGSVVWGEHLRPALGLGDRSGVEVAVTHMARALLDIPASTEP